MSTWGFGLRAKSMLALLLACLFALLFAALVGWQMLEGVRKHFGEAYARNFTELKRQSIFAPVSRELALSQRLANSEVTLQWLRDEKNAEKKAFFFKEADGYRKDFRGRAYFIGSAASRSYWFNDDKEAQSDQPRYNLDPNKDSSSWFFSTIWRNEPYNINVNDDPHVRKTNVWFNVQVRDGKQVLGVTGTALDLTSFIDEFINTHEVGITPIIITASGAIQAHRNKQLIAINQAANHAAKEKVLANHLATDQERKTLFNAMAQASADPGKVSLLRATLDGKKQLLALSYIPELKWHIVTAVDFQVAQVLDQKWLNSAIVAMLILIGILLLGFAYAVEKLVLQPLRKLQHSAAAMAQGNYNVSLPTLGRDELGDLSRAFDIMAHQVRSNTEELESKVQARTQALESVNEDMRQAHQQINDSIDYASVIQRAILPDQQLRQWLGPHHFMLWRPRDALGGDFYIFRAEGERYLVGVVDCAGHGVSGALMTMLARSALDHAMNQVGIAAPAAILTQTDKATREMLQHYELPKTVSTTMNVGLVYVDREHRSLRFSGAKMSLFWSDGNEAGEIKGDRHALGDQPQGDYVDKEILLRPGVSYYLATDGFLDQAGGEMGPGFGNTRFAQLLLKNARLPMAAQAEALDQALEAYQGDYPQRDDITILSFRFD